MERPKKGWNEQSAVVEGVKQCLRCDPAEMAAYLERSMGYA